MANEVTVMRLDELERLANYMAKSNLFGIKTPDQAVSLMALCQAEGLHPAVAARDYHIVQGRPTLKADAMLSRFQQAGGKVEWKEYTDKAVTGIFSHPQGGKIEISWTIEMAKNANLTGKDVWRQYPRQMLRARVISEGIRTVYPGVAVGIYTPEEAQDFEEPEVRSLFKNASFRNAWTKGVIDAIESSKTLDELKVVASQNKPRIDELVANGNEIDLLAVDEVRKRFEQVKTRIKDAAEIDQTNHLDESFERAMARDEERGGGHSEVVSRPAPSFNDMPMDTKEQTEAKAKAVLQAIADGHNADEMCIAAGGEEFFAKLAEFRLGAYKKKIMES